MAGERSVGDVVNAVGFSDGSYELLAVVRHNAAEGELTVDGLPGAALQLKPLPYTVTERQSGASKDT